MSLFPGSRQRAEAEAAEQRRRQVEREQRERLAYEAGEARLRREQAAAEEARLREIRDGADTLTAMTAEEHIDLACQLMATRTSAEYQMANALAANNHLLLAQLKREAQR